MSSLFDTSEEKTNGTRLARLLVDGGTHALREFLHSLYPVKAFPDELNKNFTLFQNLKRKRKIFDDQWEKLFPSSGDLPDSKTFDITLLHLLLREICYLTKPITGWHDMPADGDNTQEAHIVRIKCFRNDLCHSISTDIPGDEFEAKWAKISHSLVNLGLDQTEIDRLKTEPIDHDTKRRVEEEVKKIYWEPRVSSVEQELHQLKEQISSLIDQGSRNSELSSCLPDDVPEVFGRSQEIQQATQAIQDGTSAVVVITGAPGFGKTTVANKVAHELAQPQNCRVVLYCSLRSKATLDDVATSMILACSTHLSQPPENPQHWLLNWSKQQLKKVTFVLDNADDALESQDSRNHFVNLMCEMRTLSKQNITFAITSRKTISTAANSHIQIKDIRLTSLPPGEATKILLSKVHNDKTKQKLTQTARMVELCGCVPLALCIVGSLLSDYKEDELIGGLQKKPLDVLRDDELSLENTIQTSFDLLNQREQKTLVILSVFPGAFDSDAAKAVIAATTDSGELPMMILRSLKNRSLLEKPSSDRYQVHQLIQAFAKKIGQSKYPQILVDVEKVACAHFVNRLSGNAERYWSKDKCKESIEAFNEDRHNFEYFLQIYVQAMAEKPYLDPLLETATKSLLVQFPQKCMYLEMCLLPSFYIMILEKLLLHFNTGNQPVHTVELLCLLANEKRKVGRNRTQYIDFMEQAKQVYHRNYTEFKTNGLSQVLFFNSYARFLFEKRLPKTMGDKIYEKALELCKKKLHEHPETAATLLLMGKHRRSIQVLEEATDLFTLCLGEHFMTAQGHKAIADVYFTRGETEFQLDRSFFHYAKALTILEECGMGGHKESILSLKNYAVCCKNKGNFQMAKYFLEKAKRVADIELEDDHRWKVMIDTELALLYKDVEHVEEAKAIMKKALEMYLRLEQPIDRLGNKNEILQFLNCYPDTFSEITAKLLTQSGHSNR